jgi:hypothetical protein
MLSHQLVMQLLHLLQRLLSLAACAAGSGQLLRGGLYICCGCCQLAASLIFVSLRAGSNSSSRFRICQKAPA